MTIRHTTARATILIAGVLAATMALAGCTPSGPTPTPTPTVSPSPTPKPTDATTPAPESEGDALEGGKAAIAAYNTIRSAIERDPATVAEIDQIAIGAAADRVKSAAQQLEEKGITTTGEYGFEYNSGFASEAFVNGTQVPFGTVQMQGCYDTSDIESTNADGTPAQMNELRRFLVDVTVVYIPEVELWKVQDLKTTPELQEC